jgi:3-oxoacyl-[acyl-carrier protein] reductase
VSAAPQGGARSSGSTGSAAEPASDAEPSPSRVVLVTGASRGIGLACARWFLARGDRVAATYLSSEPPHDSEALRQDLLLPVKCDVRSPDDVEATFTQIEQHWGHVEVLVANAGMTRDRLVLRMSESDWSDVIETNLSGVWRTAKRAVGRMVRARAGRIIVVSSVGAFVGMPGQTNYAASKAGLVGMARAMAREVASRGITVNVVAPGIVETDMVADLSEPWLDELRDRVPFGRCATPLEVASAIGFLASPEAGYITGSVLPVDGGLAMGL